MKKNKIYAVAGIISFLAFSSCVKQIDKTFTGATVVELDAAPLNSLTSGQTYTIFTRIPTHGLPISTSRDSTARRLNGTIRLRVNLVGPQTDQSQTIGYKIFGSPITSVAYGSTVSGQLPSASSATLAVSDAIAGTHYETLSGICTIPAQSSFGFIDIVVRNNGATAGQARFIGIRLDSSGTLRPNPNYNRLGITIDQR